MKNDHRDHHMKMSENRDRAMKGSCQCGHHFIGPTVTEQLKKAVSVDIV